MHQPSNNGSLQELQLKLPKRGIPITIGDHNRIEECREHFRPMISIVRSRCSELELPIHSAGELTGQVHLSADDPTKVDALMQTMVEHNCLEECGSAIHIEEAALNILAGVSDEEIAKMLEHIRQCVYCSWLQRKIVEFDSEDGPALQKDSRFFGEPTPDPLPHSSASVTPQA